MGNWAGSLEACDRSIALGKGGTAEDWFFQAMVRGQKGDKDQARKWFDKAVGWTKQKDPKNREPLGFWEEAAELLGQPGPSRIQRGSPRASHGRETTLSVRFSLPIFAAAKGIVRMTSA